jgi:hypothetical protein
MSYGIEEIEEEERDSVRSLMSDHSFDEEEKGN